MESFDCRISCKYDTNYNYLYCRTETYYKRFNSGCSKIKKTGEVRMSTFYEDNMNIKKIMKILEMVIVKQKKFKQGMELLK